MLKEREDCHIIECRIILDEVSRGDFMQALDTLKKFRIESLCDANSDSMTMIVKNAK
jgi:hypothetical protein